MAEKIAFATTLDFTERAIRKVNISDVHYSAVQGVGAVVAAEPPARARPSAKHIVALQTLREHRQLFTAQAVVDRAERLKTT